VSYGALKLLVAMDATAGTLPGMVDILARPGWRPLLRVSVVSVLALLGLLFLFDVNTSSLLRLYREGLARCFLSAAGSNEDRDADSPDIMLSDIAPLQRPFHLANATANAWSLLGATRSFTFSPTFCGLLGPNGGYRPTDAIAGNRLSLGTVLAISGAAVSPNARGFGGGLGIILGLANARLGQWLGNPTHANAWKRQAPRFGGLYWFRELLGRNRADAKYLYLTDGGHFDNLGIYELVARGCRLIMAIDVGCDPLWAFEDLANAIRKCAHDFGVEIRLADEALTKMRDNYSVDRSWAVGAIFYPDGKKGVLLYVKPSLSSSVPIDVMSYGILNPAFPHESTADQFFDDAQFESYRRLGLHICLTALNDEAVQKALAFGAGNFPIPKFDARVNA
jgi:hypothetical protein